MWRIELEYVFFDLYATTDVSWKVEACWLKIQGMGNMSYQDY